MLVKSMNTEVGVLVQQLEYLPGPNDPMWMELLVLICLIVLVVGYIYHQGVKRGRTILLIGPSFAGKTSLFMKLVLGLELPTVPSETVNQGDYMIPESAKPPLLFKDVPGDKCAFEKFWKEGKTGIRGIILILDAAGGRKAVREAAKILYDIILFDPTVQLLKPRILIFANKNDRPSSKLLKNPRLHLELELLTLRIKEQAESQTKGLYQMLGAADREFYNKISKFKIEFATGSAKKDLGLGSISDWLEAVG